MSDEFITIDIERNSAHSNRILRPRPSDRVYRARYLLRVRITALKQTVYVPVSVGSGRVSTGFVYQVEGTAAGKAIASITCHGKDIMMVTLGSILYSKIPVGKTATYTLSFTVEDLPKELYKIVIGRIDYKLNTNDSRYKRFLTEIETDLV